jgi:hypothetical protein
VGHPQKSQSSAEGGCPTGHDSPSGSPDQSRPHGRYTRFVRRLETPQSVQEAGRIEISFDPASQKLCIHAISIFRDGKLTNFADLQEIKIIQRERELERGIYDGYITALILLNDLRTGDVIDVESTITSDDTIFPDHYWSEEYFEHTIPVCRQYFSWLSENQEKFQINDSKLDVIRSEEETPNGIRRWGQVVLVWCRTNFLPSENADMATARKRQACSAGCCASVDSK